MADAEAIAAQPTLPADIQKAIASAFEDLREKAWSNEDKLAKAEPSGDNQPKSYFADPFALLDSVGMGYRNAPTYLTYDTLRQVAERDTYVAPIILTRIDQVCAFARPQPNKYSVGFKIQPRYGDKKRVLSDSERERCDEIQGVIINTGREYNLGRDGFRKFLAKFVRDSLTFDQATFECTRTRGGSIYQFNATPSDTIRTATPKRMKGTPPRVSELRKDIQYVQVINSSITAEFTIDEMAFCVRNPRTSVKTYGYGLPEIETLMTTITSHLWAEEWNRKMFSQGSTIKGVMNIKGNIQPSQFEAFKRMWHSQVAGVANAWKTPMINSEEIQWHPLQLSNTEMGYQMWMDYLCFVPGTRVMTPGGEVAIEDVEPGDEVYSHTGAVRRVANTQEHHHRGKIVNIAVGGETIRSTPEHPFFVAERLAGKRVGTKVTREFAEPAWINACDLDPGRHYMLVPKQTYEHRGCNLDVEVLHHVKDAGNNGSVVFSDRRFAHNANQVASSFKLDAEAAFVLGLYAAEGNATERQVFFTFSASEKELADRVVNFAEKYLRVPATVYKAKESTLNVRISSRLVAELFTSLCGGGAYEKRIPAGVMQSPLPVQRAFFSGHFAGDGSVPDFTRGSVVATTCSVSSKLVGQLQTILLRSDVFAQRYETEHDGCVRHRLDVNGTQAVKLSKWLEGVKGERLRTRVEAHRDTIKTRLHEDATYFYIPIRETWSEDYDGPVHNMEVDVDNTYQVNRFATHNCKVTCALFRIDPAEINFDLRGGAGQQPVFMSTNEAQQKASKDRGLQPLMHFVEDSLNRHVVWKIDPRFELAFVGLDAKTEEQAQQLRMQQVQNTHTLNEVRAMDDLPPVQYGDNVMNATYMGYKMQKEQMTAMAQQPPQGQMQPGQPGQEQPQPRFSEPHGEEEQHGAEQLRQFAEPKQQSGSSDSSSDEDSGPSPKTLSTLHRDDWSSIFEHSVKSDDLMKAELFDTIDLD